MSPATYPTSIEATEGPVASDPGLVGASAVTLGASVLGLGVAVVRTKILAVLLGPAGVAVLANVTTFNTFAVALGNAFTGPGATKAITEARAANRLDQVRWLVRYTLGVPVLLGFAVFAATYLTAPWLSTQLTGTTEYAGLLVLAALFVPVLGFSNGFAQALQAFLRIARIAVGGFVGVVATLVATGLLTIAFGLSGAVAAIGVGALARVAYFALKEPWVLASWHRHAGSDHLADRPSLAPILRLSASGTVLGLSSAVVALLIRANIVSTLGLEANGIYQPVFEISDVYLVVLLTSTGVYLFAKITEQLSMGQRTEAAEALGHGLRLLMVLTVPIALVCIGWGDLVIRVLYSESFVEASGPLAIQMAGNVLKVIGWSLGAALLPLGMYRSWLAIGLGMLAIHYVGVVALGPTLGLDGVALAYVLAWTWSAVATAIVVRFLGRLWPSRRDWRVTGLGAALVVVTFAAVWIDRTAGAAMALASLATWLLLMRSDLAELASEALRQGPIRFRGRGDS